MGKTARIEKIAFCYFIEGSQVIRPRVMENSSEFSNVTLASADDNDNTDVIVLKKLDKFSKGEDLHDALQFNMSRRIAVSFLMLLLLPRMIKITQI